MRRFWDLLAVAALTCALALSLAACGDSDDGDNGSGGDAQQSAQNGDGGGGDSGSGATKPGKEPTAAERKQEAEEQKQILKTSSGVYAAIADRSGKALCGFLTEEARSELSRNGGPGCAKYYYELMNPIDQKGRDRSARRAKFSGISIDGDKAIATVTFDRKNAGVIELVRADGGWEVASFTMPRTIVGTR